MHTPLTTQDFKNFITYAIQRTKDTHGFKTIDFKHLRGYAQLQSVSFTIGLIKKHDNGFRFWTFLPETQPELDFQINKLKKGYYIYSKEAAERKTKKRKITKTEVKSKEKSEILPDKVNAMENIPDLYPNTQSAVSETKDEKESSEPISAAHDLATVDAAIKILTEKRKQLEYDNRIFGALIRLEAKIDLLIKK